jgi:hypothetical protein
VAHAAQFGAKHFARLVGLACVNFDFFNRNTAPFSRDEVGLYKLKSVVDP